MIYSGSQTLEKSNKHLDKLLKWATVSLEGLGDLLVMRTHSALVLTKSFKLSKSLKFKT